MVEIFLRHSGPILSHTFRSMKELQFWSPAFQDNRSTELFRGEWSNHDPMDFSIFLKDNHNTLCLIHLCLYEAIYKLLPHLIMIGKQYAPPKWEY